MEEKNPEQAVAEGADDVINQDEKAKATDEAEILQKPAVVDDTPVAPVVVIQPQPTSTTVIDE